MDNNTLLKLQQTELQILIDLSEYCDKNNIQYSLAAGTALGAIRHKGFIPWDDDVDITMTRGNYERFCKCWENEPLEGYSFENYINHMNNCINHGKVRKNGTVFLKTGEKEDNNNHGIWVDIFPMDKISIVNKIQRFKIYLIGAINIILTRAFETVPTNNIFIILYRLTIKIIPTPVRMKILNMNEKWLIKNDKSIIDNYQWISMSCFTSFKHYYPEKLVLQTKEITFEENTFKIFKDSDIFLRELYGNYMQLPPPEKRVNTHNPAKIVFEVNE